MQNPPLQLLKYKAFPDVAASLRTCSQRIMQRWQQLVVHILPAAEELTLAQLRDHVPQILAQMIEALEASDAMATQELIEVSQPHGAQRFHQNYNVNELLIEYHVLRRVILEEVGSEIGRPLESMEIVALNLGIDTALRRGVVTYVEHQTQQLSAANELQSRYLSFLSHDLRGGLNGALLMIEVLKRELAPMAQFAETVGDLDMMRRSILDTVGTMDRFLHAEMFRKGKVQVRLASIDIAAMLSEQISQQSYTAREKKVEIKTNLADDCRIVSDKELLSLIFQNLMSNAIKYSSAGKTVTVTVDIEKGKPARGPTHREAKEGARVCRVSIRDEGPGISPEALRHLFEPFTRGATHGQKGAGLGLSIAKQAADLLSADLRVESEIGVGATFHVGIPDKADIEPPVSPGK